LKVIKISDSPYPITTNKTIIGYALDYTKIKKLKTNKTMRNKNYVRL